MRVWGKAEAVETRRDPATGLDVQIPVSRVMAAGYCWQSWVDQSRAELRIADFW